MAARGIVSRGGGDRLLVSDDGRTWYTPGGRLVPGESLKDCVVREVHEEAGQLSQGWKDLGGRVEHIRFVAEEEWNASVYPEFLRQVGVGDEPDRGGVYRGFDRGGQPG